jgi:DNA (cytosine-5)-methyltransferase 1
VSGNLVFYAEEARVSTIQPATQLSLLSPSPLVAPTRIGTRVSYPIVSFFSGAGFLDLGLRRAGYKILWSCEYDRQICDTHDYAMEHYYRAEGLPGDVPYIECRGDIQKIKPLRVQKEAIGGLSKGEGFGVVGGPPCPDFSIGGKNRGGPEIMVA